MAVAQGYGKTSSSGLVFTYDTGDTRNSYKGRPTANLSTGYTIYNYNNVGGNVSTSITSTSETYKGATVYKQTLTPLDSSGVSYLSNANNPGLGVYTAGGGGTGGRYTGHSIFFKPTGPLYSTPIFTHYSNIGGWQSSTDYEDMGDGWFRAKVIWYGGSTAYDQKYWAINPSGAIVNVPITVYWAGPFKEDLNSTTISQFIEGTRSATQGLLPLVGASSLDLSNVSFDSSAGLIFDGTNDYIDLGYAPFSGTGAFTIETVYTLNTTDTHTIIGNYPASSLQFMGRYGLYINGACYFPSYLGAGTYYAVATRDGSGNCKLYLNGVLSNTASNSNNIGTNSFRMGTNTGGGEVLNGKVPVMRLYNRALTQAEITQNYRHYKTRFNLS